MFAEVGVLLVDADLVPRLAEYVEDVLARKPRCDGDDVELRGVLRGAVTRIRANANAGAVDDLAVCANASADAIGRGGVCTPCELAELMGVGSARVRQIAAELGIAKRGGRWLFDSRDVEQIRGRTYEDGRLRPGA